MLVSKEDLDYTKNKESLRLISGFSRTKKGIDLITKQRKIIFLKNKKFWNNIFVTDKKFRTVSDSTVTLTLLKFYYYYAIIS